MAKINITELDFFEIKENLKTFLKQQNEFKDYDFEGSGLQVLLDLLSANTYYNSIYQNMVMNESFMDTAILRESVVSKAKSLGYTPRSKKSAEATITLTLKEVISNNNTPIQPEYIVLPEYSNFTSSYDNSTYLFVNMEPEFLTSTSTYTDNTGVTRKLYTGTFRINQGIRNQQNFVVDYKNNPDQRFIIKNDDVDLDTLIVKVKESNNSEEFIYSLAQNVTEISPDDRVYWIIENENGNYELEFGNGRIGKKLIDDAEVNLEYLISQGSLCNKFKIFNWNDVLSVEDVINVGNNTSYSLYSISTVSESFGGNEKETVEEIRFAAPKNYETQNRAVTSSDYRFIVENKYKFVDSVKTWGGEDNDPPEYGKVFLSLKPKKGYFITDTAKDTIKNDVIKDYNVVTITPEIIDPYYTEIILDSEVKYNLGESPLGENFVKQKIIENLNLFDDQNLQKFDSYFRFSKLTAVIDDSHDSIKSNDSKIKLQNKLKLFLNESHTYLTNFNNSLSEGTLQTSQFGYLDKTSCFLEDSDGIIDVYYIENGFKKLLKKKVGSVDYIRGKVVLSDILIQSSETDEIKIIFKPLKVDLIPYNNQIFLLDFDNINLKFENISNQFLKG